jgi:hypothetical protein
MFQNPDFIFIFSLNLLVIYQLKYKVNFSLKIIRTISFDNLLYEKHLYIFIFNYQTFMYFDLFRSYFIFNSYLVYFILLNFVKL